MQNDNNSKLIKDRSKDNWISDSLAIRKKNKNNLANFFLDISREKIEKEQFIINDFDFNDNINKLGKWIDTVFEIIERNLIGVFKEINSNYRNKDYLKSINKFNNLIKEKFEFLMHNDLVVNNGFLGKVEYFIVLIEIINGQIKILKENFITEKRNHSLIVKNFEYWLISRTLDLMKTVLVKNLNNSFNYYKLFELDVLNKNKLLEILNRVNETSNNVNEFEILNLIIFLREGEKERLLSSEFKSYLLQLEFYLFDCNNLDYFDSEEIKINAEELNEIYNHFNDVNNKGYRKEFDKFELKLEKYQKKVEKFDQRALRNHLTEKCNFAV